MRIIRELDQTDIGRYQQIAYNSYPTIRDLSEEGTRVYKETVRQIMAEDGDVVTFYGMFEDDEMTAVMRLFNFEMNLFGRVLPASGLGFLGVDLLHKKKGMAREMIQFYEEVYRQKGLPIASLLPFRPDFYKAMGYGFGTKVSQYRVSPEQIPRWNGDLNLRFVDRNDLAEVWQCHDRVVEKTHGMIRKIPDERRDLAEDPYNRIVGSIAEAGGLNGYLVYQFKSGKAGNYTVNEIYVNELVYESQVVLRGLLEHLRRQADQARRVIFNTGVDAFHYLFANPLNDTDNYIPFGNIETNTQAIGMMYKVLDLKGAFKQCSHRNYNGVSVTIRFVVEEPFSGVEQSVTVDLREGRVRGIDGSYEREPVTAKLKLCDFSALFMGCVSAAELHALGLLETRSPETVMVLDRAFYCSQKPVCNTDF